MNKLHRFSALLLAVVMIASLAACGKKQPDIKEQVKNTMESVASDIQSEAEKLAEKARSSDQAGNNHADEANSGAENATENGGKTSGDKGLDLEHASFDYVNPFSEGLAWVIHKGQIKVINKEGKEIFKTDSSSYETDIPLPFKDGVSCYNVGDNYFIIDKEGKTLYQTKEYKEDDYEQILAYGNGGFLVHRFSKGFKDGKKTGGHTMGMIDKNGKEITEFYAVDFTPEEKWDHLCDGVFYEPLDGKVFDTQSGKCSSIGSNVDSIGNDTVSTLSVLRSITAENGKVWVKLSTLHGLGIMDVHTLEIQEFNYKDDNNTFIIDDIGVVDGVYYNLSGEKVAEISAYMPNVIRRGDFSDSGVTPLVMNDGSCYITYVDKNGKDQFDPIKLGNEWSFTKDHFADSDGTQVVVYDNTGKEVCRKKVTDHKDLRLYDDYFIAGKNYYFFK
ncbi:hypothetical protein [Ruminococcus sp.]|uniref:hypothetical protein n=1 Tax=Ruminococcus sp. TaxID=41978 RepID=UPI002E8055C3|nr:hypothetical protein [Ruminococcus sp.]MEE3492911.1 hypothetical protein [Ruminococcus sp.]